MRVCSVVCTLPCDVSSLEGDIIGVDRGALYLAKANKIMTCAMGDFDSISSDEKHLVEKYAKKIETFNPIKDDTDLEAALHYAISHRYDRICVYGALGGRQDHNFVNMLMLFSMSKKIELMDEKNRVFALGKGIHTIEKSSYKYCSFFTMNTATISLDGFAYPLSERKITRNDFYTVSNEIVDETGTVEVHRGKILVMQCKD